MPQQFIDGLCIAMSVLQARFCVLVPGNTHNQCMQAGLPVGAEAALRASVREDEKESEYDGYNP
jgi:hypothetical protein